MIKSENIAFDAEVGRRITALDVGCRWGFAERFISNIQNFQIYGFDPDALECERLAKLYADLPVHLVPLALAGSSGPRKLYLTKEPACSSLLMPDPALTERYPALSCAKQVSTVMVQTVTIDEWIKTVPLPAVDYIKLDTQGTELEILVGGLTTLESVRCVEVEVEFNPIYIDQPLFSDVDIFMRKNNFVLWKITNQVHYSFNGESSTQTTVDSVFYDDRYREDINIRGGQIYWANAHYIKKNVLDCEEYSLEQRNRDLILFNALGLSDVVNHIEKFI